jgi:hypothetical protein
MGGRGETVLYKRIFGTDQTQRDSIKADIIRTIDATITNITVIALLEMNEAPGTAGGQSLRMYATNQQEREQLKTEIGSIIDSADTNITVIALVESGKGPAAGSGG